jgi:hypothetical protein
LAAAISRWCRRRRWRERRRRVTSRPDYELVQQIGTKRAWEVFLGTHPTGFYADLARAQIEALSPSGQRQSRRASAAADTRAARCRQENRWSGTG